MNNFYILTFENTHGAISGESTLKQKNINNAIMPTPTFITKSCGLSIRINEEDMEAVRGLINEKEMKVKEIYFRNTEGYRRIEL